MNANYLKLNHSSMKNVKLVIGNGFDLTCGLKSSYGSFFEHSHDLYKNIEKLINSNGELPLELSAWDIIFYLLKNGKTKFSTPDLIDWKDVENVIKLTLGFQSSSFLSVDINLDRIYNSFIKAETVLNKEEKVLRKYLSKYKFNHHKDYYELLLTELEKFEKRFSNYLKSQMTDDYQEKARKLLTQDGFLKFENHELNSIDTFNYTTPRVFEELKNQNEHFRVRHINGTLDSAIFGIDSQDVPISDPRYIFTKSYRKMVRLAYGEREDHNRRFDNVVIYGHSLTEADYSYFFSIMDKLELNVYDIYSKRLIIAFGDFKENIEKDVADSTIRLLDAYDRWKNPRSNRHGLVEVLETSDRIGFIKIKTSMI